MTTQRTPRATRARWLLGAGLSLSVLAAAGCSRTSSGANSGDLFIQSCSLACTSGQGGAQVNCNIINVHQNDQVSVLFSEPLDPSSIGPATFQVIDVTNGTTPDGTYLLDPLDPRRAIFRPAITFGGGAVGFSLRPNTSYEVLLPGQAQGDGGPFITSVAGNPNRSRLQCTIFTSEGVVDPVPGNPRVEIAMQVVTGYNGDIPIVFPADPQDEENFVVLDTTGPRLEGVYRSSPIIFRFNELMNIATVGNNGANGGQGSSPFIAVEFDLDGNLSTTGTGDRLTIGGQWRVTVDNVNLTTKLRFDPSDPYPSSGTNPANPRLLVLRVPQQVVDLTNKPVTSATGGGTLSVVTEALAFQSVSIPDADGENFDNPGGTGTSLEDVSHNGANWGQLTGGQFVLAPGITGGSGRLGELLIGAGETVTLNTDSQMFPLPVAGGTEQVDVIGNDAGGGAYPFSITVTDGVFEFASLVIRPGGTLRIVGSNPARVVVRGPVLIDPSAKIDVSGTTPAQHDSILAQNRSLAGATRPAGGPGAGGGGLGADRANMGGTELTNLGNPPFALNALGAASFPGGSNRNGQAGEGVGGSGVLATNAGGGGGGPAYPPTLPTVKRTENGTMTQNVGTSPDNPAENMKCLCLDMGGPGGGGAYSRPGASGAAVPSVDHPIAQFTPALAPSNALRGTPGAPGDASSLALEPANANNTGYSIRLLDWENGHLRGGAGGGGGGNHPYMSRSNGDWFPADCFAAVSGFVRSDWAHWHDHSGASGGGGGGAVDVVSGKRVNHSGLIDARGGQGGSSLSGAATDNFGQYAQAGGGGSGGAVRMRATTVNIAPGGTRIDVRGGAGGNAFWSVAAPNPTMSMGGVGGSGLVRIEDGSSAGTLTFAAIAPLVAPFDSGNVNDSLEHLSVAANYFTSSPVLRPDSISAASSCWIRPSGNFLELGLRADSGTLVSEQGWTMNVVVDQGGAPVKRPFRGTNAQFPMSWEGEFNNLLGYDLGVGQMASPIVVRFQGARASGPLSAPCDVDVNDISGPIVPGSLTRWVAHPAELNDILDPFGNPLTPNILRFVVIFDRTIDPANPNDRPGDILVNQGVIGVDDLLILADPE